MVNTKCPPEKLNFRSKNSCKISFSMKFSNYGKPEMPSLKLDFQWKISFSMPKNQLFHAPAEGNSFPGPGHGISHALTYAYTTD
jgi:hypothetical protein